MSKKITHTDLVDLTFEVAEQIAQYLQSASETASDLPDHATNARDYLVWAAYKIRTNAWREGWERDPATTDPRESMAESTLGCQPECAHCARRSRSGLEGQCPVCAQDRVRAERAALRIELEIK